MKILKSSVICIACSVAFYAFAQTPSPQCGVSNFDPARNIFTIIKAGSGAVNQQCFVTVHPRRDTPQAAETLSPSNFIEGRYMVELSGGGGGGAGGTSRNKGGGGGGAGAAPSRSEHYLSPGVYKLTIGTGGEGGSANGGTTSSGNPTSLVNADSGQLIAGFAGADVWKQQVKLAKGEGKAGLASAGGSSGGTGADNSTQTREAPAEAGTKSQTPGYYGSPGQAGAENPQRNQANAGGGGGAGVGSGGSGESANRNAVAGVGDLGGGGGGGRGGAKTADAGGRGGDGFIKLTSLEPVRVAAAPVAPTVVYVPQVVNKTTVVQKYSFSTDTLFAFGKISLNPAGAGKLDEFARKHVNASVDTIVVVGHADRIGSEETNQEISVARAEAVKSYLVSAGVPAARIFATGRGESEPVTASGTCLGAATPKVIACLQPDRRVDVEINATVANL